MKRLPNESNQDYISRLNADSQNNLRIAARNIKMSIVMLIIAIILFTIHYIRVNHLM